jgi:hypothetical protein
MYERHPGISAEECKRLTEDTTPALKHDLIFQELFLSAAQVVWAKRLIELQAKCDKLDKEARDASAGCPVDGWEKDFTPVWHRGPDYPLPDYKPTGDLAATPRAPGPSAGSQTLTPPSEGPLK